MKPKPPWPKHDPGASPLWRRIIFKGERQVALSILSLPSIFAILTFHSWSTERADRNSFQIPWPRTPRASICRRMTTTKSFHSGRVKRSRVQSSAPQKDEDTKYRPIRTIQTVGVQSPAPQNDEDARRPSSPGRDCSFSLRIDAQSLVLQIDCAYNKCTAYRPSQANLKRFSSKRRMRQIEQFRGPEA
jgi:hypothetical protein